MPEDPTDMHAADQLLGQLHVVNSHDEHSRLRLARQPDLHPEAGRALLASSSTMVRRAVAYNLSTPESTQMALVNDQSYDVVSGLVSNRRLAPSVMHALIDADDEDILEQLANRNDLPAEVWNRLAGSKWRGVTKALHNNPLFTPTAQMPIGFLESFELGRGFVIGCLRNCDPAALSALKPTWSGTIDDLVIACTELGPDE